MTIQDVHYFKHNRYMQPRNYQIARSVEVISHQNEADLREFVRRLKILQGIKNSVEHQARVGDFISELKTFERLHAQDRRPHWVPESKRRGVKMPDIYLEQSGTPVEVKTLGLDLVEGRTLRQGQVYSGPHDWNYFEGVQRKLDYFFEDVEAKFRSFNESGQPAGELYLYYFPSQHVRFRDGEDGLPMMGERMAVYAVQHLSPEVRLEIINILDSL